MRIDPIKIERAKLEIRHYNAMRRVGDRMPAWANKAELKQFYVNCPKGMTVDHIIPSGGNLVTGLHVIENLQYLTAHENKTKSNLYKII